MANWEEAIGRTAHLRVAGSKNQELRVPVLILSITQAYGRVFARVSPQGGHGEAQVTVSRLEWSDWKPPLQPYEESKQAVS